MLRDGTFYNDLGSNHFARHDKTRAAMRLVRRIKDLASKVEANGKPITARAICWVLAGHTEHHLGVLKERYGA